MSICSPNLLSIDVNSTTEVLETYISLLQKYLRHVFTLLIELNGNLKETEHMDSGCPVVLITFVGASRQVEAHLLISVFDVVSNPSTIRVVCLSVALGQTLVLQTLQNLNGCRGGEICDIQPSIVVINKESLQIEYTLGQFRLRGKG